jgi:hypothetical protein
LPAKDDFDFQRARLVLNDLERSIRGRTPTLAFEWDEGPARAIRGVANRVGLLRMGLQLASLAIEADAIVAVRADGRVTGDGEGGLIEISLIDEPLASRRAEPQRLSRVGFAALVGCGILTVSVLLIGSFAVLQWVIGRLSH